MFVLRKTMEAAVEAQREHGSRAVMQLATAYGDALNRSIALQQQMSAWVLNVPGDITPEQAAQMFYAQDDAWQAAFFNCMQEQVQTAHDALPPPRHGELRFSPGYPPGEGQWWYVARLLDDSGFETLEAMFEHAKAFRERAASDEAAA